MPDNVGFAMTPEAQLDEGSVFGKYQIVRLIGQGGMGAVYEAIHPALGKRVALKVLPRSVSADPLVHARFIREGQLASMIRHPNVVDVTDVGVNGETPYMVMEFLEGEDLGSRLDRQRPVPVDELVDLMLPVVAAVGAAHDAGIVHRDLKPENIYLARARGGTLPKLLDFGVSKIAAAVAGSNDLTKTSSLLGTPYYMSPEQVRVAKTVDSRSDLYSLGVILYECAAGARPFEDETLYNLLLRIVNEAVVPPRHHNPSIPEAFQQVVLKAMARDVEDRYANVYQLGEALLPFATPTALAVWQGTFSHAPAGPIVIEPGGEDAQVAAPVRIGAVTPIVAHPATPFHGAGVPRGTEAGVSGPVQPTGGASGGSNRGASILAVAALGVLVLGGGVVIARKLGESKPNPPVIAQAPPASQSAAPKVPASATTPPAADSFTATLRLKMPAGSVAKVNNAPAELTDGKVKLSGPAETVFYVSVTKPGGELLTQKVFMAQGFLVPDEWDVSKGTMVVKPPQPGASTVAAPAKSTPDQPPDKPRPAPTKSVPVPGATTWDG